MSKNSNKSSDSSVDMSVLNLQPKYKIADQSTTMNKTPGNNSTSRSSFTVASVIEGKGQENGIIGLACMDLRSSSVDVYEFIDSSSYMRLKTKLQVEDPVEILLPDSINDKTANILLSEAIKNVMPDVVLATVHKRYFHEQRGCELVQQLANSEISNCDKVIQQQKRLAMAALAALLKYVEHIQNVLFTGRSLRVTFLDIEKLCIVDAGSWGNLELVDQAGSNNNNKGRRSLLSLLDNSLTIGGKKLLRSNLLQPSTDPSIIDARLDAVEALLEDEMLLNRLREILRKAHDLDQFITTCSQRPKEDSIKTCEKFIMQLLRLKRTLDVVGPLNACLQKAKPQLLCNIKEHLMDDRIEEIIKLLTDNLDMTVLSTNKRNSITLRNQKCYAIREGISVKLDVARKAYEELWRDLQLEGNEPEKLMPEEDTRLVYSALRGFHYVWICRNAATAKLPSVFINEVRNRSSITFSSRTLIRYNDRIDQSVAEVMLESGVVADKIISMVRQHIPVLYHIIDAINNCDFLCCLALYANSTASSRPHFGPSLLFKDGRHPLLDASTPDAVVPNDTYLTVDSKFAMITGPNMAGKSTYLKQVCQLSVLAQTGSMVPADYASIPIFNRIFSRVGHNDNLLEKLSAFAMEMSEMAVILKYSDNKSLVVIDELARSTSTEEGISISFAICEDLIKKDAFVMFATHFLDLACLDIHYTTVENLHFAPQVKKMEDGSEVMETSHKLYRGPYTGPLYGFELVQLSGFPDSVIENARKLAHKLRKEEEGQRKMSTNVAKRRILVRTAMRLRQAILMARTAEEESVRKYISDVRNALFTGLSEAEEFDEEEVEEGTEVVDEAMQVDHHQQQHFEEVEEEEDEEEAINLDSPDR